MPVIIDLPQYGAPHKGMKPCGCRKGYPANLNLFSLKGPCCDIPYGIEAVSCASRIGKPEHLETTTGAPSHRIASGIELVFGAWF